MGIINELSLVYTHANTEFKNRNIKENAFKQIPEFAHSINTRIGITEWGENRIFIIISSFSFVCINSFDIPSFDQMPSFLANFISGFCIYFLFAKGGHQSRQGPSLMISDHSSSNQRRSSMILFSLNRWQMGIFTIYGN